MAKKALISGYIGFSNFGDDAMLEVLSDYLKSKDYEITALSADPKLTKETFKINSVYYKDFFGIIKEILRNDVIISGGGNLIQNETSNLSLFYYLFIIFISKIFMKKVILFSQGIGPVKGKFQEGLVKSVLRKADLITVRDIYSQRILTKWKIPSKFTYDAIWSIKTPEYNPQNIVGIQLRDYKFLHKDFYKFLAKYIDMFFGDQEIRIYSFQNKSDAKECYALEKYIKQRNMRIKTKVVLYKNTNQILDEFSKLKYLIAMRLHANILGLKYGIKTVPVSYSVKVRNLAYEFDIKHLEASEEPDLHPILTELTRLPFDNAKMENARKRKFEWGFLDNILK